MSNLYSTRLLFYKDKFFLISDKKNVDCCNFIEIPIIVLNILHPIV